MHINRKTTSTINSFTRDAKYNTFPCLSDNDEEYGEENCRGTYCRPNEHDGWPVGKLDAVGACREKDGPECDVSFKHPRFFAVHGCPPSGIVSFRAYEIPIARIV